MMDFQQYHRLEFASPQHIRKVQDGLLRQHLDYLFTSSPYYRELAASGGVAGQSFGLDDLASLPLTGKPELGQAETLFQAVPIDKVVDIVFSSGTSGLPTRIAYTEHDLERLAYNEHQSLAAAGIERRDTVLLTCTMDRCFIAGLAYFLGLRRLGAATVRNGHGTLASHLEIIRRISPTVLIGVPSFLLKLGQYLAENGEDPARSSVRTLICIGEPVRDRHLQSLPVTARLIDLWQASVHSTYASSEMVSTFCECTAQQGGHLHPELAVVEIIDQQEQVVPDGEVGEVVVTPLAVEGMPLLRFRTGDLSFLRSEPCACGRNSPRLGPILARREQMLKIRGTTVYPQAIARVLEELPTVQEHYLEVSSENHLSDLVVVHVGAAASSCSIAEVVEKLQAHLRVKPQVVIEPVNEVRAKVYSLDYRKPRRFFDRRN